MSSSYTIGNPNFGRASRTISGTRSSYEVTKPSGETVTRTTENIGGFVASQDGRTVVVGQPNLNINEINDIKYQVNKDRVAEENIRIAEQNAKIQQSIEEQNRQRDIQRQSDYEKFKSLGEQGVTAKDIVNNIRNKENKNGNIYTMGNIVGLGTGGNDLVQLGVLSQQKEKEDTSFKRGIEIIGENFILSPTRGFAKLYTSEAGYIASPFSQYHLTTGTKFVGDSILNYVVKGKLPNYNFKERANYNVGLLKDPDVQNVGAFALLGGVNEIAPLVAKIAYGEILGKQIVETVKNPTFENKVTTGAFIVAPFTEKAISKSPLKFERFNIQTKNDLGQTKTLKVFTAGLDVGTYGKPLLTITNEGLGLPKNKINPSTLTKAYDLPKTAMGSRTFINLIEYKNSPNIKKGVVGLTRAGEILGNDKGLPVKEYISRVEDIKNPKEFSQVIESLSNQVNGNIFGSETTAQLPKKFKSIKTGDVDIVSPLSVEQIQKIAPLYETQFERSGNPLKFNPDELSFFNPEGIKKVELKSSLNQESLNLLDEAPSQVAGLSLTQGRLVKFGETKATPQGLQFKRKIAGATITSMGGFGETTSFKSAGMTGKNTASNVRGLKDVAGSFQSGYGLVDIAKKSKNPITRYKGVLAEKRLNEAFANLYTKEQRVDINKKIKDITGNDFVNDKILLLNEDLSSKGTFDKPLSQNELALMSKIPKGGVWVEVKAKQPIQEENKPIEQLQTKSPIKTKEEFNIVKDVKSPSQNRSDAIKLINSKITSAKSEIVAPSKIKSPINIKSPVIPRSPISPNIPRSPVNPKSPVIPRSPISPNIPRSPVNPKSPNSPISPSPSPSPRSPSPSPRSLSKISSPSKSSSVKSLIGQKAFSVLLKRKGNFVKIAGGLGREKALDVGTRSVKGSIGATFKIVSEDGYARDVKGTGEFARYQNELRNYAVRKGRRVALQDTYIQRRSTRLGTRAEVSSINASKKYFKGKGGVI